MEIPDPHHNFFDRPAKLFLLAITVLALVLTAAGIHGSSLAMMDSAISHTHTPPLLGSAKTIRMDEWADMTPAILYQLRRPDRLAYRSSPFGPDNAALLANLPTRHWTTLFRPQFWPFFILPDRTAFAAYWQFKSWSLLAGLFLLCKLFLRSSKLAIVGTLWFYFSSFTQWWFSSPTALPEMVGMLAFSTGAFCMLVTARKISHIVLAAIVMVLCGTNFILCLYPSYLVPLAAIGILLALSYCAANRWEFLCRPFLTYRLIALALAAIAVAAVLVPFMIEIHPALAILATTTYPGHRLAGGGEVSLAELANHALNFFETEKTQFPAPYNVCEAAGFLWLAPFAVATLFLRRKSLRPDDTAKYALLALTTFSALLVLWMLLPKFPTLDQTLFLTRISSHRAIIALGLANILITFLALRLLPAPQPAPRHKRPTILILIFIFIFIFIFIVLANQFVAHLPALPVLLSAILFAALAACIILRQTRLFALLLLIPLIAANALINPLDRGFKSIDRSALHQAAQNPSLRHGRWLVFSKNLAAAPFFAANGLNVFNTPAFIPNLPAMQSLDNTPAAARIYDNAGFLRVTPLPTGSPPKFSSRDFFVIDLALDPLDPRLQQLNIRYLAFDVALDPLLIPKTSLQPLFDHPIDNFRLYEIAFSDQSRDREGATVRERPWDIRWQNGRFLTGAALITGR